MEALPVVEARIVLITHLPSQVAVLCECQRSMVERHLNTTFVTSITSVGATQLMVSGLEEAAFFSSGGFSNVFPTPSYQAFAVSQYLQALGSRNAGKFNITGRAFPDISAVGTDFQIMLNQTGILVNGTSASSPAFASTIALLNDRLIAAGKSPMGFLNPFLYSTGRFAFTDITIGSNPGTLSGDGSGVIPGCGTPVSSTLLRPDMQLCRTKAYRLHFQGFPALPGWDPVTGLGTPNFEKLLAAVGL